MTDHSSVDRLGRCRIEDQPECHRSGYSVPESRPATTVVGAFGEQLTTDKIEVPGGWRWTVTGQHGTVAYDSNGNQLALLFTDGEIDSAGDRWADKVHEYTDLGDDAAVYEVLADWYRTQLAGGALVDAMAPAGRWGCEK